MKGVMNIERESDHMVIPDAFIIDELRDKSLEHEKSGYLRPTYASLDLDDRPLATTEPESISSSVIIIEL